MVLVQCLLVILCMADVFSGFPVDTCNGVQRSPVDYGDLTQPGSGRVLQVNGNHFEIFGEKVFLSGLSGSVDDNHYNIFGNDLYQSTTQQHHECLLRNLSQLGGNSIIVGLHARATMSPIFNSTGHVTNLDRSGSFIKDVRKYLRAAAHYNIVVFFNIWWGSIFKSHPQLGKDTSQLQSYIDNALLPLVKAIKDERGFGGFSVVHGADGWVIAEKKTNPCFDTHKLKEDAHAFLSMRELLRFVGKHVEAIRSVDHTIPITMKTHDWREIGSHYNHYADECFHKAGGSSTAFLSFYIDSNVHLSRHTNLLMATSNNYQEKPLVLNRLTASSTSSLQEKYQYAYSHGYSGAWTLFSSKNDHGNHTDSFLGIQSLKSKDNISLGGLVNFTLTKYEICRQNSTKCVETN